MELFIGLMGIGLAAIVIVYLLSPLFAWMRASDARREARAVRSELGHQLHQLRTQVAYHAEWLGHLQARGESPAAAAAAGELALGFAELPPTKPEPAWVNPPAGGAEPTEHEEAVSNEETVEGSPYAQPDAEAQPLAEEQPLGEAQPPGDEGAAAAEDRPDEESSHEAEPTPAVDPAPAPATPKPATDAGGWEQWLGVRGAAGLGAALLVLSGLYFFRYSIEAGWLTAPRRVFLGLLASALCVGVGDLWLRKRHRVLAHCVMGAGIALTFLSSWAATALYDLWPSSVAALVMVAATALCCTLSLLRRSRAIAAFGLIGGFATPALLSTGQDRPLILFAYLLLLDAGLLVVARKRGWSPLVLLSIVGTAVYETYWVATQMGPSDVGLGMLICGAFATLFAAGTIGRDEGGMRQARAAAVLLPFGLTVVTSVAAQPPPLLLLGAYLTALTAGGVLVAHRDRNPWLGVIATAATLGSLGARLLVPGTLAAQPLGVAAIVVVVGAVLHGIAVWGLRRVAPERPEVAPVVWAAGSIVVTAAVTPDVTSLSTLAPLFIAWCLLAASAVHLGHRVRRPAAHLAIGAAFGVGSAITLASLTVAALPLALGAVAVALAGAFALTHRMRGVGHGLALAGLLPLTALLGTGLPGPLLLAVVAGGTACAVLAAERHRAAGWLVAAQVVLGSLAATSGEGVPALVALGVATATLLAATVRHAREAESMWLAAAAIPVLATPAALTLLEGVSAGLAPIALAGLTAAATHFTPQDTIGARGPQTWLRGIALGLATLGLVLHFSGIALALVLCVEALALLALWRHHDHAGLPWVAAGLLSLAVARVLDPAILLETLRGPWPVLNRFALAYAAPALALFAAGKLLGPRADARRRGWEPHTQAGKAILPTLFTGAAIVLGFAWLNVCIVDLFTTGPTLALGPWHHPARDLSLSLAWAVYALLLLVGGSQVRLLRLTGLGLLLATSGKVFLYDLSHLDGLYRVLSLGGLAASLLLVSMGYQRFLHRDEAKAS